MTTAPGTRFGRSARETWQPTQEKSRRSIVERKLTFELEKDTKNTYRFQEVAKGSPPVIGTLYIQKWLFESAPTTITVTITA